ncbi:VHL beta domain-containing protein [Micromonospora fluostatini]|uniref:VHL beta domain-containing protein n=1 Tax=Micromonospora sp. JCM 30529 TaxID=3421643 RepID=UPI003D17EB0A
MDQPAPATERSGLDLVPALVAVGLLAALAIGVLPFVTGPKQSDFQPLADPPIAIVGADGVEPTSAPTYSPGPASASGRATPAPSQSVPPADRSASPAPSGSAPAPSTRATSAAPTASRQQPPLDPPPSGPGAQTSPTPSRQATTPPTTPELAALPPHREVLLRSVDGGTETYVEFVNARSEPVVVHWLDHRGHRQRYRTLDPGQRYRQRTYVGHPWLVTTARGWGLACFQPQAGTATAVVR